MRLKDGYVLRTIANQHLAVPIGQRMNELHGMIALNDSGAFLWNHLKKETTIDSLTTALVTEYDVSFAEAKQSVIEFSELLKKENLLEG